MPSVRAWGRTGTPQSEGGMVGGNLPRGRMLDFLRLRCWPVALEKVAMASVRARTALSEQDSSSATQSSAYCEVHSRCSAMMSPTCGMVQSQQSRAHATNRYMAGASGQPCRTPASHWRGREIHSLTTADAFVSWSSVWAQPTMPGGQGCGCCCRCISLCWWRVWARLAVHSILLSEPSWMATN